MKNEKTILLAAVLCAFLILAVPFVLAWSNYTVTTDVTTPGEKNLSTDVTSLPFGVVGGSNLVFISHTNGKPFMKISNVHEYWDELTWRLEIVNGITNGNYGYSQNDLTCRSEETVSSTFFPLGIGKGSIKVRLKCEDYGLDDQRIRELYIDISQEYAEFYNAKILGATPPANQTSVLSVSPATFTKSGSSKTDTLTFTFTPTQKLPNGYTIYFAKTPSAAAAQVQAEITRLGANTTANFYTLAEDNALVAEKTPTTKTLGGTALGPLRQGSMAEGKYLAAVYYKGLTTNNTIGAFLEIKSGAAPGAFTASMAPSVSSGTGPLSVTFDISASQASAGKTLDKYELDFGDGSPNKSENWPADTSPLKAIPHSYSKSATAILTVWEKGNATPQTALAQITVNVDESCSSCDSALKCLACLDKKLVSGLFP